MKYFAFKVLTLWATAFQLCTPTCAAESVAGPPTEADTLREQYRQRLQASLNTIRQQAVRELDAIGRRLEQMRSAQDAEIVRHCAEALARGDALPVSTGREPRELVAFRQHYAAQRKLAVDNAQQWLKAEIEARAARLAAGGRSSEIPAVRAVWDEAKVALLDSGDKNLGEALSPEKIVELFAIPKGRYVIKDSTVEVAFGPVQDPNTPLWCAVEGGLLESFSFDVMSESHQGILFEVNGLRYEMSVGHWDNEGTQIVAGREIVRLKQTVRSPRRPNNIAIQLSDDSVIFFINGKSVHTARRVVPRQPTDCERIGFFSHAQKVIVRNMIIRIRPN